MKYPRKVISIFLSVIAMITCILPTTAFAATNDASADDADFTKTEFEALNPIYAEYEEISKARATALILGKDVGIAKSGSSLIISGYTTGSADVVKCGFKEVVIERRKNSNSSWGEYKVYKDLYSSSNKYTLSKSVTVPSGYQYRVTVVHYAKASLFSTQKVEGVSGYLSF